MLTSGASALPPNDVAALQARVAALSAQLAERDQTVTARDRIIATLKEQLAALRRRTFGRRLEKLHRTAEQLELQIEELEQQQAERAAAADAPTPADPVPAAGRPHPVRQPLPAPLPRVEEMLAPPYAACPGCGGALRRIGEDVSEVLEVVPARLRVRRYVRPVMACRGCGDVSQAPAPPVPLPKSNAGASLLAEIVLAKYDDHLPAYRQAERFAREGLALPRSTLTNWLGRTAALLAPLAERIAAHVLAARKLHADDTPVPVLAPGAGKTRTGRLWVYVRDDRACADSTAPAVLYRYSLDRKGEHPQRHLAGWTGEHVVGGDEKGGATAQMAFFGPLRARRCSNCALRELPTLRLAAQAHWASVVLSQGAPLRRRVDWHWPALSSVPSAIAAASPSMWRTRRRNRKRC